MKGKLIEVNGNLNYGHHYIYETDHRKWRIIKVINRDDGFRDYYEYWGCSIFDTRFRCNNGGSLLEEPKTLNDATDYIDKWEEENDYK